MQTNTAPSHMYHVNEKEARPVMDQLVGEASPMCLDFEWDSHDSKSLRLSLVQIASRGRVHIFDAMHMPTVLKFAGFASAMKAIEPVKVLHGASADVRMLRRNESKDFQFGKLFDTQIAHSVLKKEHQRGLGDVISQWLHVSIIKKSPRIKKFLSTPHQWMKRPLPDYVLQYAADDVFYLPELYSKMRQAAEERGVLEEIFERSRLHALGKQARLEALQQTVKEFRRYLTSNEDALAKAEQKTVLLSAVFPEWQKAELQAGRFRYGSALDVLAELHKQGFARSSGGVIAFATDGGRVRSAAVAAAVARVQANRAEVEADKMGVKVSAVEWPSSVRPNESAQCKVEVRNCNDKPVTVTHVRLMRGTTGFSVSPSETLPFMLKRSCALSLTLASAPHSIGMCYDTLVIGLSDGSTSQSIGRFLSVSCGDVDLLDELGPVTPYTRVRRARRPQTRHVRIPAPPNPDTKSAEPTSGSTGGLPKYKLPSLWHSKLSSGSAAKELEESLKCVREENPGNLMREYKRHFERLLWTEEVQLLEDLASFDLVDENAVDLAPRGGGLMSVHVKGLAEKRPSVLRGDTLRVNRLGQRGVVYDGRAVEIEREDVILLLDKRLTEGYIRREKVEIRFVLSRAPLRIFHQGLDHATHLAPSRLFPPAQLQQAQLRPARQAEVKFVNQKVAANEAQREAVIRVVQGEARAVPYVLFGPPGTGKTTTLIEMIVQCMRLNTGEDRPFRILACAPTNTAADLLCLRLSDTVGDRLKMLRIIARSRSRREVEDKVLGYSNWDHSLGEFSEPAKKEVENKAVVVATLATAGKLVNIPLSRDHFDLIAIDEAGQAMEPEAVAPITTLCGQNTQLVLAGDPMQLGPVIHSTLATDYGLSTSLLERLMTRPLYLRNENTNQFNPLVLSKLVKNFRSHSTLLQLPNELFYQGELLCCADTSLRDHCCGVPDYDYLPLETNGLPIKFHGIVGKDDREGNSPSWFNKHECVVVLDYVKALLRVRGKKIKEHDIGIITPYHKQAQKMIQLLKGADVEVGGSGIKVGSTELFQGQERKVIIISTVRSSVDHVGFDLKHNIGFLRNPKRFNVATTRAIALMIIVGNPQVLASDPCWGRLLRFCIELGGYKGVPVQNIPTQPGFVDGADTSESDTLAEALEDLLIGTSPSERVLQEGVEMPAWS